MLFDIFKTSDTCLLAGLQGDYDHEKGPLDLFTLSDSSVGYLKMLLDALESHWAIGWIQKKPQIPPNASLDIIKDSIQVMREKFTSDAHVKWYEENGKSLNRNEPWFAMEAGVQGYHLQEIRKEKEHWHLQGHYSYFSEEGLLHALEIIDKLKDYLKEINIDIRSKSRKFTIKSKSEEKFLSKYREYSNGLKAFINDEEKKLSAAIISRLQNTFEMNDIENGDVLDTLVKKLRKISAIAPPKEGLYSPSRPFITLSSGIFSEFHKFLIKASPGILSEMPYMSVKGAAIPFEIYKDKKGFHISSLNNKPKFKECYSSEKHFPLVLRTFAQFNISYYHYKKSSLNLSGVLNQFACLENRMSYYYQGISTRVWDNALSKIADDLMSSVSNEIEYLKKELQNFSDEKITLNKKYLSLIYSFLRWFHNRFPNNLVYPVVFDGINAVLNLVKERIKYFLLSKKFILSDGQVDRALLSVWLSNFEAVDIETNRTHYELIVSRETVEEEVVGLDTANAILITNSEKMYHLKAGVFVRDANRNLMSIKGVDRGTVPYLTSENKNMNDQGPIECKKIAEGDHEIIVSVLLKTKEISEDRCIALRDFSCFLMGDSFLSVKEFHTILETFFGKAHKEWEDSIKYFMSSINPKVEINYWLWLQKYAQASGQSEFVTQNWITDNLDKIDSAVSYIVQGFTSDKDKKTRALNAIYAAYQLVALAKKLDATLMVQRIRRLESAFDEWTQNFDGSEVWCLQFFRDIKSQNYYMICLRKRLMHQLNHHASLEDIHDEFLNISKIDEVGSLINDTISVWLFQSLSGIFSLTKDLLSHKNIFWLLKHDKGYLDELLRCYATNEIWIEVELICLECIEGITRKIVSGASDIAILEEYCCLMGRQLPDFPRTKIPRDRMADRLSNFLKGDWSVYGQVIISYFGSDFTRVKYYTKWLSDLLTGKLDNPDTAYDEYTEKIANIIIVKSCREKEVDTLFDLISGFVNDPSDNGVAWLQIGNLMTKLSSFSLPEKWQKVKTAFETLEMLRAIVLDIVELITNELFFNAKEKLKLILFHIGAYQKFLTANASNHIRCFLHGQIILSVRRKLDTPGDYLAKKAMNFSTLLQKEFCSKLSEHECKHLIDELKFYVENAFIIAQYNQFALMKFEVAYSSSEFLHSALDCVVEKDSVNLIVDVLIKGISRKSQANLNELLGSFNVQGLEKVEIEFIFILRSVLLGIECEKEARKSLEHNLRDAERSARKSSVVRTWNARYHDWRTSFQNAFIAQTDNKVQAELFFESVNLRRFEFSDSQLSERLLALRCDLPTLRYPEENPDYEFSVNIEMPGNEYTVRSFARFFLNDENSSNFDLFKGEASRSKNHIFKVEPYTRKVNLAKYFEKSSKFIWDAKAFTRRFLVATLINVAYDKPDQEEAIPSIGVSRHFGGCQPFVTPVYIDRNTAFLGTKDVIYCFDEMHEVVDPQVTEDFCSVNVFELLYFFEKDIQQQTQRYMEVFDDAFWEELTHQGAKKYSQLKPYIRPTDLTQLYINIVRLQQILIDLRMEKTQFSHFDLLEAYNPQLAAFYKSQLLLLEVNPLERLRLVCESMPLIQEQQTRCYGTQPQVSLLEKIDFNEEISARDFVWKIAFAREELLRGKMEAFSLLSPECQRAVIDSFGVESIKVKDKVNMLLCKRGKIELFNLSTSLAKTLQFDAIKYIQYLNLFDSMQMTETVIKMLFLKCQLLRKVVLKSLPALQQLDVQENTQGNILEELIELVVSECEKLERLVIKSKSMRKFIARGNPRLLLVESYSPVLEMIDFSDCLLLSKIAIPTHQLQAVFLDRTKVNNKILRALFSKEKNRHLMPELSVSGVLGLPFNAFFQSYPTLTFLAFRLNKKALHYIEQELQEGKILSMQNASDLLSNYLKAVPLNRFMGSAIKVYLADLLNSIKIPGLLLRRSQIVNENNISLLLDSLIWVPSVRVISLSNISLGGDHVVKLINLFRQCGNLRTILLYDNSLVLSEVEKIINALERTSICSFDCYQAFSMPNSLQIRVSKILEENRLQQQAIDAQLEQLDLRIVQLDDLLSGKNDEGYQVRNDERHIEVEKLKSDILNSLAVLPAAYRDKRELAFAKATKKDEKKIMSSTALLFNFSRLELRPRKLKLKMVGDLKSQVSSHG